MGLHDADDAAGGGVTQHIAHVVTYYNHLADIGMMRVGFVEADPPLTCHITDGRAMARGCRWLRGGPGTPVGIATEDDSPSESEEIPDDPRDGPTRRKEYMQAPRGPKEVQREVPDGYPREW